MGIGCGGPGAAPDIDACTCAFVWPAVEFNPAEHEILAIGFTDPADVDVAEIGTAFVHQVVGVFHDETSEAYGFPHEFNLLGTLHDAPHHEITREILDNLKIVVLLCRSNNPLVIDGQSPERAPVLLNRIDEPVSHGYRLSWAFKVPIRQRIIEVGAGFM